MPDEGVKEAWASVCYYKVTYLWMNGFEFTASKLYLEQRAHIVPKFA
jgi:hypothetical protein